MGYLLDTCVISDFRRRIRDPRFAAWRESTPECRFRSKPAGYSDLKPATVPI